MASKNVSVKKKKKVWYGLYAPESFNNAFLGETQVYSPDDLVGKTVSLNLAMVTNDMKKQNIIASFRVNEVKDNKGMTELLGYSLSLAYIKRLVRRKRDKIDDSFIAKSKDGKSLRIKTVAMTNSKTHESATSAIRLSLRAKVKKALKEVTFTEFVNSLINLRLQKDWKNSLSKIYPIKFLEVRFVGLEESKRNVKEEEEKDYTDVVKSAEDLEDEALNSDEDSVDSDDVVEDDKVEDIDDVEDDIVDDVEDDDVVKDDDVDSDEDIVDVVEDDDDDSDEIDEIVEKKN